jgi:hypothetical protein
MDPSMRTHKDERSPWGFWPVDPVAQVETHITTTTPISSPAEPELRSTAAYKELEETLSELHNVDYGEHWKMDDTVYNFSIQVAAALMARNIPEPGIFTHGPKSVVFTWSRAGDNLYLTISARRISVLISSKERVEYRAEIVTSPVATGGFLSALSSLRPTRQLEFLTTPTTSAMSR